MKRIGIEPMKNYVIEFTAQLQLPTLKISPYIYYIHNIYLSKIFTYTISFSILYILI